VPGKCADLREYLIDLQLAHGVTFTSKPASRSRASL